MAKLFVYGTLQRGHRLNRVLGDAGAVFETKATTVQNYSMLFGGQDPSGIGMYPVVMDPVKGSPAAPIVGEVYKMPDGFNWDRLDAIEGAYDRRVISVSGELVYLYVGKKSRWLGSGGQRLAWTKPHSDGNIYWVLPEVNQAAAAAAAA
jgi:gamma-glutamylcyclotransferase (GGCT)/AIG2-like uncharacterized protein YtfP